MDRRLDSIGHSAVAAGWARAGAGGGMGFLRLMLAAVYALVGLPLAAGGCVLLFAGGTPYYLVAGLIYVAVAICVALRRGRAAMLYALLLAGTLIWSIAEVGLDFWGLLPRLPLPLALGIPLLVPPIARRLPPARSGNRALAATVIAASLALLAALPSTVFNPAGALPASLAPAVNGFQWQSYGGDA
ncbi:MAG TPA: hypothetical protein VJM09_01725, partial [Sphingobium sp.]|nr:hypothetical protein [Sphingobium sp.]